MGLILRLGSGFLKIQPSFKYWNAKLKTPEVECEDWFEKQFNRYETERGGMNALIEKQTGVIGHAGLVVQTVDRNTELEIAYLLLPVGRNKGFATEAAIKCRDVAFQKSYSDSLISIISITNITSANVAAKNGVRIAKQTMYNENAVNIFRISKTKWQNIYPNTSH
ncbi:MAG: GNAT family N-acetyltransferase [Bacteroidota bacterium]